jgi:anti-sigma B factor antagonist
MTLAIRTEARGDIRKVLLTGRLDTNTAPELDGQLKEVVGPQTGTLVLDLAELEYISSAGLRSVFRAEKGMKEQGGRSTSSTSSRRSARCSRS